jgi:hypothetical protein
VAETDIALTSDGAFVLRVADGVHDRIAAWIPNHRSVVGRDESEISQSDRAILCVKPSGDVGTNLDDSIDVSGLVESPTLTLANVAAHISADRLQLRGPSGVVGDIDLVARRGTVRAAATASTYEVHGALTLAAALLLGRIGHALIHAAALVDPLGRGWLLVGDSHAGKTTTCATLITAGWQFIADDQVVVHCNEGRVVAEGWPREPHLDAGWAAKEVEGRRIPADLHAIRSDAWSPHAELRGVVFPVVAAEQTTRSASVSSADALTRIVRQSPWLFADVTVAPATLALLTRIASLECSALILGRDSYAHGDVLAAQFPVLR